MKTFISFLIFCLVATCNAELRTWTAVNGNKVEAEFTSNEKGIVKLKLKSGKVFEVPANKLSKEDNEFIGLLVKPEGVNYDELEERGDYPNFIYFVKGSDTLYTGKSYRLLPYRRQKMSEGNYKDGKLDGLWVEWHPNGQKRAEINYKNGKQNGLETCWHENGQKWSEGNIKDGKLDGLQESWHENGRKWMERKFKNGELISEKFWNSKGEPVESFKEANKK